jgi:hypothetical protein
MNTASASPKPIALIGTIEANANAPNTVIMIAAALVMIAAVCSSPHPTASVLSPVRRYSSRTLASKNTS